MSRDLSSAAALSLAFSCACFMGVLAPLNSPRHDVVLHLAGPASALFVPALLNITGLALLCFLLLASLQRLPALRRIAMAAFTALLPWIVITNSCSMLDATLPHAAAIALNLACAALFLVFVLFPRSDQPLLLHARSALHVVYLSLAAAGLLFLSESAFFGIAARHLNRLQAISPELASRAGTHSGRVIWIVLDELGHQQVFGDRLPGLMLPNFDRLRRQSTVFSDVLPAGTYTEVVLPDLMSGIPAAQITTSSDGRHLTLEQARTRTAFQPSNTVFADALHLGYRNAAVGWYVPYCRLLPGVLSSCFWTGQSDLSSFFPSHAIAANTLHPLLRLLHRIPYFFETPPGPTPDQIEEARLHFADYVSIRQATEHALADTSNDFILIHAPIPHPEGIWDRQSRSFAVDHSAYIDNLALADIFLGDIMHALQQRGEWDDSTIVLMGDHAWRTQLLWTHSGSWRPIDQLASSGGRFDPRPAYLVKLPHQQTPATISVPFPAIQTRALLDELLRRDIASPLQLQEFALSQARDTRVSTLLRPR